MEHSIDRSAYLLLERAAYELSDRMSEVYALASGPAMDVFTATNPIHTGDHRTARAYLTTAARDVRRMIDEGAVSMQCVLYAIEAERLAAGLR